jgi:RimJ/RimL family protein N-acetyltransferase
MQAVRIEPLGERHTPAMLTLANDEAIARTSSVPLPCTAADIAGWIDAARNEPIATRSFAIIASGGGSEPGIVGLVTLKRIDRVAGSAELSFWIGRKFWGRGYATMAAERVVVRAFTEMGLTRLTAHYLTASNPASGRALARLGFTADPTEPDLPVAGRFAISCPGDHWTFVELRREEHGKRYRNVAAPPG